MYSLPLLFSFFYLNKYVLVVAVYFCLYSVSGKFAPFGFLKKSPFWEVKEWVGLIFVFGPNNWFCEQQVVF